MPRDTEYLLVGQNRAGYLLKQIHQSLKVNLAFPQEELHEVLHNENGILVLEGLNELVIERVIIHISTEQYHERLILIVVIRPEIEALRILEETTDVMILIH